MRPNCIVHVGSEARHAVVARPAPDYACDLVELDALLSACAARRALQQRHQVAQALSARAHSYSILDERECALRRGGKWAARRTCRRGRREPSGRCRRWRRVCPPSIRDSGRCARVCRTPLPRRRTVPSAEGVHIQ